MIKYIYSVLFLMFFVINVFAETSMTGPQTGTFDGQEGTNLFRVDGTLPMQGNSDHGGNDATNIGTLLVTNSIGVGVNTPASTLPSGFTLGRAIEIRSDKVQTDAGIFLRRSDGTTGLDIWMKGNSPYGIYFDKRFGSGDWIFRSNAIEEMRIKNGGGLDLLGVGGVSNITDAVNGDDGPSYDQARNFANMTNVYFNITFTIQDPTNDFLWSKGHPFDGTGNWTLKRVRGRTDEGDVTGTCTVVVGDWNTISTSSTTVEVFSVNTTGVSDGSLSGFTTISNDQKIGVWFSDLSTFAVTNEMVIEVQMLKE